MAHIIDFGKPLITAEVFLLGAATNTPQKAVKLYIAGIQETYIPLDDSKQFAEVGTKLDASKLTINTYESDNGDTYYRVTW